MQSVSSMPSLLDNLRFLESAQGYAELGLYMQANNELEGMSPDTRLWPEVLAVKLAIFDGLDLHEMSQIVMAQLLDLGEPGLRVMARPAASRRRRWVDAPDSIAV